MKFNLFYLASQYICIKLYNIEVWPLRHTSSLLMLHLSPTFTDLSHPIHLTNVFLTLIFFLIIISNCMITIKFACYTIVQKNVCLVFVKSFAEGKKAKLSSYPFTFRTVTLKTQPFALANQCIKSEYSHLSIKCSLISISISFCIHFGLSDRVILTEEISSNFFSLYLVLAGNVFLFTVMSPQHWKKV